MGQPPPTHVGRRKTFNLNVMLSMAKRRLLPDFTFSYPPFQISCNVPEISGPLVGTGTWGAALPLHCAKVVLCVNRKNPSYAPGSNVTTATHSSMIAVMFVYSSL